MFKNLSIATLLSIVVGGSLPFAIATSAFAQSSFEIVGPENGSEGTFTVNLDLSVELLPDDECSFDNISLAVLIEGDEIIVSNASALQGEFGDVVAIDETADGTFISWRRFFGDGLRQGTITGDLLTFDVDFSENARNESYKVGASDGFLGSSGDFQFSCSQLAGEGLLADNFGTAGMTFHQTSVPEPSGVGLALCAVGATALVRRNGRGNIVAINLPADESPSTQGANLRMFNRSIRS